MLSVYGRSEVIMTVPQHPRQDLTGFHVMQNAKEDGCKLLTGGGRQPGFEKGYYMAPTIFTGVKRDSQLWNEEVGFPPS